MFGCRGKGERGEHPLASRRLGILIDLRASAEKCNGGAHRRYPLTPPGEKNLKVPPPKTDFILMITYSPSGETRSLRGFGLIEIMIAMAIVGVLATVAIPKYMIYQLKTKSAEAKTNLSAVRSAQEAYFAEFGIFVEADPQPVAIPGNRQVEFDSVTSDFEKLGWQPEGNVYFSYGVGVNADATAYTADAGADIDQNGVVQFWGYAKPDSAGVIAPSKVGCNIATLIASDVRPCSPGAGQSIF
jgi:prepilin-type N-terminal cleavage/methylation domain-containing protein